MEEKVLMESPLFGGLTAEEITTVLTSLPHMVRGYKRDQFLLHSGEPTQRFGLMLEGEAIIFREDYWGNRNILDRIVPGDIFGESYACVPGSLMRVSVESEHDCTVLWLRMHEFLEYAAHPLGVRLMQNLAALLAEKTLAMNEKLTHLTQRSIREKALSFLTAESQRQGREEFEIYFNRQQLADYLSVDRSALSAELSRMQREGILSYHRNRFRLHRRRQ